MHVHLRSISYHLKRHGDPSSRAALKPAPSATNQRPACRSPCAYRLVSPHLHTTPNQDWLSLSVRAFKATTSRQRNYFTASDFNRRTTIYVNSTSPIQSHALHFTAIICKTNASQRAGGQTSEHLHLQPDFILLHQISVL